MPSTFPNHGAIFAKTLAEDLLEQGFSEDQVFEGTDISPTMLQSDKPVLEIDRITSFFEHAAELLGNNLLGFERGQIREMRRSGLISYIGVSSPTVLDFLLNMTRYRRVFSDAIELDSDRLETDGVLKWYFSVPTRVKRLQFVEFGASGLLHAIRQAADRPICPVSVTFRHSRKTHIEQFEHYFGCPVRFGGSENSCVFRPTDLAQPLVTADDELYKVLKNCCEHALQLKARNIPPIVVEVERAISDQLSRGETTQDDIARTLGMSPRTLSRRLAKENTTFFRTLEELRQALAMNYLRDSNLALAEVSFLLGYSGLSSFTDAFKRWTGKTPGQYRAN